MYVYVCLCKDNISLESYMYAYRVECRAPRSFIRCSIIVLCMIKIRSHYFYNNQTTTTTTNKSIRNYTAACSVLESSYEEDCGQIIFVQQK